MGRVPDQLGTSAQRSTLGPWKTQMVGIGADIDRLRLSEGTEEESRRREDWERWSERAWESWEGRRQERQAAAEEESRRRERQAAAAGQAAASTSSTAAP